MNPDMPEYALTGAAFDSREMDGLSASADGETEVLAERPSTWNRPPVFAVRSAPADWHGDVDQAILRLLRRGENWDSHGAAPIDADAVANAREIARTLALIDGVPQPTVGGTPDGEVGLAWDVGEWSLDLTVDGSGLLHYVYLDEADSTRDVERRTRNSTEIANYLTRLPRR